MTGTGGGAGGKGATVALRTVTSPSVVESLTLAPPLPTVPVMTG